MKASEKGVWLNLSLALSNRRIFFCSMFQEEKEVGRDGEEL